jgi:ABC-2 type transport system ATP-binding protein
MTNLALERAGVALTVDELVKTYADGSRALDRLSLRIPAHSFFGLLGPNGAGKTTLIGAVAGLVRVPAGRAFVFGNDVVMDLEARVLVGVAPQEVHLDRFLSAHELLAYHGRYFGMPRLEARRRADELLEVFDLTAKANTKPNRLSGGMRRRLLIARALVHRPRLLILDEPTAGVDLELRYELWHYLRRLHADEGLTILLTTHYIEEAEALCERVAFIKQGRIIDEGTPQELIALHGTDRLEQAYVKAMRA